MTRAERLIIVMLRRLFSADYLYAVAPLADGPSAPALALWALFWLGICAGAWAWRRRASHGQSTWVAHLMGALGLLGGLATAVQVLGQGPFSARIWALSLAGMALALPAAHGLARQRPAWLLPIASGLAANLSPDDLPLSKRWLALWLLLHLAGMAFLLLVARVDVWVLAMPLVALAATAVMGRRLRTEVLAPLLLPYGAAFATAILERGLGVETGLYQAFAYPDPWSLWFDGRTPLIMGIAWMLASTLGYLWRVRPRPRLALTGASVLMAGWWGATYARHLSHGASASDPYAYLQMAADLASYGSPRRYFPLTARAQTADVPLWPLVPVGYHPPLDGWAATVWPTGWPTLLAQLYRLGGEALAMWGAPFFLLIAAWLTYRLTALTLQVAAPHETRLDGLIGTGGLIAAGILLTSYEAATRSLVPMADAAVAALGLCTVLALLYARRTDRLAWSAASGLALALTYHVRHPQLPLALAALPAYGLAPWPRRRRMQHLLLFAVVALVAAIPDLLYHTWAFGAPWITESPEWFLMSPRFVGQAWSRLWNDGLWWRNEFGYLWPLIGLGLIAHLRAPDQRRDAWVLLAGFGGVLLFHLFYAALRMRDMVGLYPWLALWAGWGAVALWRWANRGMHPNARRAGALLLLLAALTARSIGVLELPLRSRVATFGHVTSQQRAGFATLDESMPADAIVGTALNAGAITRYTGRDSIRPAAWSPDEFDRFVDALAAAGRPLYLLADGEEMSDWLPTAAPRHELTCQGSLDLPLYGRGGQPLDGSAILYLVVYPD